jgi:sugar phosphate isomerase/epimerase
VRVAIRTDFLGNDIDRIAEYASVLAVRDVCSFPEARECYDDTGSVEMVRLQRYQSRFLENGLAVRLLTETIDGEVVTSVDSAEIKAKALCRTIETMGKAGVDALFLLLNIPASEDVRAREDQWEHLIQVYREIVPCAEEAGVRIATHGHQFTQFLVWDYDGMSRILEAVPSEYNGVTFCTGCYQLAGDDLYETIRRFGSRIFFVHVRDVIRKPDGFEEVLFGQGEVDVFGVLKQLRDIGYDGLVCPEHLPRVSYESYEEISAAWGLGYLVSAISRLEGG